MFKITFFTTCYLVLALLAEPIYAAKAIEIVPSSSASVNLTELSFNSYLNDFKSLDKQEKKSRIKDVKTEIKKFKEAKKSGADADTNLLLLVLLAILLPPVAVYLYEGTINNRFWISLILTLLGFFPGVIYALILILGNY